jgi:hypothetical protein
MFPVIPLPNQNDDQLSFRAQTMMIRRLNEQLIFDTNTFNDFRGGGKRVISVKTQPEPQVIDETQEPFGLKINQKGKVTVYNPCIQHGSFIVLPAYGTYSNNVDVLGGTVSLPHYVCCKYARLSSLTVVSPAFSTIPTNSVEYMWFPICAIYLDANGRTQMPYRLIRSMIIFPGEI